MAPLITSQPIFSLGLCVLAITPCLVSPRAQADDSTQHRYTGPWDVESLKAASTEFVWDSGAGATRGLYYQGEPYLEKSTRVFAYCSIPNDASTSGEKYPAMVLVHGGGGKAYAEWTALWASRGYVALAMDLTGRGPDGQRLPDGGPDEGSFEKFASIRGGVRNVWTYHAIANVLRAVGVVSSMKEVDPQRVGLTGISWGGYLTCITAGLDDRVRVAVPVYGCGFLHKNSSWLDEFRALDESQAERWINNFDPSMYLPQAHIPMLFITGAKDPAYPLDSFQKSYHLVPGEVSLCVKTDMTHGHSAGWAPIEIAYFVDSKLKEPNAIASPLPRIVSHMTDERLVNVIFESKIRVVKAELYYTTDLGDWTDRVWHTLEMTIDDSQCYGTLPDEHDLIYFVNIVDQRGATVSTPHVEVFK